MATKVETLTIPIIKHQKGYKFAKIIDQNEPSEVTLSRQLSDVQNMDLDGTFRMPYDDSEIFVAHDKKQATSVSIDFDAGSGFSADFLNDQVNVSTGSYEDLRNFTLHDGDTLKTKAGKSEYVFTVKESSFEAFQRTKRELYHFVLKQEGVYEFSRLRIVKNKLKFETLTFDAIKGKTLVTGFENSKDAIKKLKKLFAQVADLAKPGVRNRFVTSGRAKLVKKGVKVELVDSKTEEQVG
ncbi:hypothetical protein HC026_02885 [Lactobacillus sp. LC28-10]|uniref:Uncharacterized protein n=1 Tax=Secundilactobacillus angelensis TaxID=2722706 RepID=A0ABX1KVA7_9LACO|nr:hypothetical protein [Secundilactobacillus angelensis]MCH5461568.1 hypothetical protein [Secundilactobacillus angelensis]NLR17863.1 hypothetical protein [Secundilactobacillus angelensis]